MNVLVLGRGKTGSLVADVVRERGHHVEVLGRAENENAAGLTPERLANVDVVVDFTTPHAVLKNVEACLRAKKPLVIGTTGWYAELPRVRSMVDQAKVAVLYGGNFSIGVNLFYAIARASTAAAQYGYDFHIRETHHVHKKDAPSGTAVAIARVLEKNGAHAEISSVREGENMGRHELRIHSDVDTLTLTHQAESRRGFALGAVRAAEWLAAQRHPNLYDFAEIFPELQ
ncbi:MAG TPA: dihydrodipicolinate reductase C-terminal domain-containing protein [Terriglobales bacterium]|jgi:4-hydroxy-tetrahydrodipicolinate reductase